MGTLFKPLKNRQKEVIGVAKFDSFMCGRLPKKMHMRQYKNKPKYAATGNTFAHRMIISPLDGYVIDHINGDSLDNRVSNLRLVTVSENNKNAGPRKCPKTGLRYRGVHYNKATDSFRARISLNGKGKHLGMFNCPHEAAKAYNKEAKKLYGEFARLNEIKE